MFKRMLYCFPVVLIGFANTQPRGGGSDDGFTPGYRITGIKYGWPVPAVTIRHTRWRDPGSGTIRKRTDEVVAWQVWALFANGLVMLCGVATSYLAWRDRQRKRLPFHQWSLGSMFHGFTTLSVAIAVAGMPFEERWMILHWKPFWTLTWWQTRALVGVSVGILVWWIPTSLRALAAGLKMLPRGTGHTKEVQHQCEGGNV